MRGVNARLGVTVSTKQGSYEMGNVLVESVEDEDERDDSVCSGLRTSDLETGGTDGLEAEEQQHARCRCKEKQTTTKTFHHEGGADSPAQIPNGQNGRDKQLDGGVGDTDGQENVVKVI